MKDNPHSSCSLEEIEIKLRTTKDPIDIEKLSSQLTPAQTAALVNRLFTENDERIPAIFVGQSHAQFAAFISCLEVESIETLKNLAFLEPLQHHLTIYSHSLYQQTVETSFLVEELEKEIAGLETSAMGTQERLTAENSIQELAEQMKKVEKATSKALMICWNTTRVDLIDAFSHTKERAEHLHRYIGESAQEKSLGTGLFAALENKLFSAYKGETLMEDLLDEEPAIEALAKFNAWYVKDYYELGLLPGTQEKDTFPVSSDDSLHSYHSLYEKVSKRLSDVGLETVRDLKNRKIFSRQSLHEYIQSNNNI